MLQLDSLTRHRWRTVLERLDATISDAASLYLQKLAVRRIPITPAVWSRELDELRMGREPDYGLPGFPLVYALRYMPRRVISVLGSLLLVSEGRPPTSVLDVGSGTGATALALDLLDSAASVEMVGLDPSQEMTMFAESLRLSGPVSARYERGSLADILSGRRDLRNSNLIVFSAPFPYGFDEVGALAGALGDYRSRRDQMILVVEPVAKSDVIDLFQRRLRAQGWPIRRFRGSDLPELMTANDLPLNRLVRVWRRLGSPGSSPPRTWWDPPDDRFLVANPQPAWPQASPGIDPGRLSLARLLVPPRPPARATPTPWRSAVSERSSASARR